MVSFIRCGSCCTSLLWMENNYGRQRISSFTKDLFDLAHSVHLCCSVIIRTQAYSSCFFFPSSIIIVSLEWLKSLISIRD